MVREGTFGAGLGPVLGLGYQSYNFNLVARPSLFVLYVSGEDVSFSLRGAYWQVSLLAGNRYQAGTVHLSGGGRMSDYGIGPVVLVGRSFGPVDLRLEGSFMFPRGEATGRLLTLGLTIGGPAPKSEDESGPGDYQ
jgi:hypothetical protein